MPFCEMANDACMIHAGVAKCMATSVVLLTMGKNFMNHFQNKRTKSLRVRNLDEI